MEVALYGGAAVAMYYLYTRITGTTPDVKSDTKQDDTTKKDNGVPPPPPVDQPAGPVTPPAPIEPTPSNCIKKGEGLFDCPSLQFGGGTGVEVSSYQIPEYDKQPAPPITIDGKGYWFRQWL